MAKPSHATGSKFTDADRQVAWDELARLLIRGATQKQCAEIMGFTRKTLSKWMNKPEFKEKLLRTRQAIFNPPKEATTVAVLNDIKTKIQEYAREAVDHAYVLMKTAEKEYVQLKAAETLMDRSTETHKSKGLQVQGAIALFTPQDLVVMAQAAKEIQTDLIYGKTITPAPIDSSLALPIEAEPFEDRG